MGHRKNIRKLLADPKLRRKLLRGAVEFILDIENINTTRKETDDVYETIRINNKIVKRRRYRNRM